MALEAALEPATPWAAPNRRDGHTVAPVLTAAVAVVVFVVAVGISVANPRSGIGAGEYIQYSCWLLCALCGAVLARSPRGRRYGWFLITVGLSAEADGVLGLILHLARTSMWPTTTLAAVALTKTVLDIAPLTILFTLGLLLFPTGRLSSDARRWRWVSGANIGATAVLAFGQLLTPGTIEDTKLRNPIGVQNLRAVLPPVEVAAFVVLLGCLIAGMYVLALRWRAGNPLERRAVGVLVCAASWVLVVVAVGIVLTVLHRSTQDVVGSSLIAITIAALPAAAVTTTVRRSMFDVELTLNRNLTYLALTVIVIGGYALTVTLLGRLFEQRSEFGISLVITGLIAVLFGPLKLAVQQGVEHVLLGRRATPYRALTTLGRRLDGGLSPADALTAAVQTVAETFRLPHAVLTIDVDGEPVTVATYGEPVALPLQYPLLHRGQRRGTLHLAPRTTYEKLTGTDERLLADFITQIAGAVEAVHLTEQLRHSRTAVVMASEEERRRIRRELHDGIGPVLASTALAVQRVERQLDTSDPRRASLTETRIDVQHAIDDIRRVVHGLRPAALDELGLAAAITQRAPALCDHVQFDVRIGDHVTGLPVAVEVVAYRVSTEAMTNVVRHAAATTCMLDLYRHDAELVVRVRDNGQGLTADRVDGIGLNSIRERLAEIGGRLTITSDEHGTELIACLPST